MEYLVPAQRSTREERVANSRFISTIGPAFSVEEARDFVKEVKSAYPDASHNVPIYQIGFGSTLIAHSSDDGEPAGTAGRPALAVLQGSGLGDTVLVITRYFGGTKLGKGGLVKAYSNAARMAISAVPKAKKVEVSDIQVAIAYANYDRISRLLREFGAFNRAEDFGEEVVVEFSLASDVIPQFEQRITEVFHGKVELSIRIEERIALFPLEGKPNYDK